MGTASNKGLLKARRIVASLGATIIQEKTEGRHIRLKIRTGKGAEFWYGLSQSRSDPFKLKGWLRQHIHRADQGHYAAIRR